MQPIQIWRFEDAPAQYKVFDFGGDEEWLVFVPDGTSTDVANDLISSIDRFGQYSCRAIVGGTVFITAHA